MYKKRIKFTDYNGNEREEDFYFNLSRAEITEMEFSVSGGLSEKLKQIMDKKEAPVIMSTFKELILKSYGEKDLDGRKFKKSPEISDDFYSTEAYVELFNEITTDANAAAAFINGISPPEPQDHKKAEN